jgi:hypothetical protein
MPGPVLKAINLTHCGLPHVDLEAMSCLEGASTVAYYMWDQMCKCLSGMRGLLWNIHVSGHVHCGVTHVELVA